MRKKLIMACMAVAAFAAFVVAPAASASPVLTEAGAPLAVGSSIEGKNTGVTKFTGSFNVECSSAILKGTLTKNSGTKIEGTIPVGSATFTGTGTGGDCTSALGSTKVTVNSELCLASGTTHNFVVTGCSGAAVVFTLEITGTGPCKYSTAAVNGTFTTGTGTVNVSEQEAKKIEGGFFCPSSGKLDMDFDLYTTGTATGLIIS
jgi:hypothetical protein